VDAATRAAARLILMRIAATEAACGLREVRAQLPTPTHLAIAEACAEFEASPAFSEDADPHGFVALHCAREKAADLAGWLLGKGAERVTVTAVEQLFARRNPLQDALEAKIGKIG